MKKIKIGLTVEKKYANYLISIAMTCKTMKDGKSGPEKYCYLLSLTCGKQMTGGKNNWMTRK